MKDQPIQDPRLIEAIEACRPRHDDLSDPALVFLVPELVLSPELADLRARLRQADLRIAEAFDQVSVPDGLADRIVQFLVTRTETASDSLAAPQGVAETTPASAQKPVSRRLLLAGAVGLTLAGSILVAVLVGGRGTADISGDAVREMANDFFRNERDAGVAGQLLTAASPPRGYPFSPELARTAGVRWRLVRGFLGRQGVAYDLAPPGKPRATLYVVRVGSTIPGLPSVPPSIPSLVTNNLSTSAWQSGQLLYVMVVDGGPPAYRSYLDLPDGPLA